MRKTTGLMIALATAATVVIAAAPGPLANAGEGAAQNAAQATYKDIQQTLGSVPSFFKAFPESGIAGAWAEFKAVQLGKTKLDGKTKELIGLGIAAQIPCRSCIYLHTAAAKANGATDQEIKEAVAMAAIVRHWSTALNGLQVDLDGFKREVDTVLRAGAEKMKMSKQAK